MGRGDDGSWTTIESDPGVFTELIEKIGVKGVQVEELWSIDKASLQQLSPVYGLIFLFKWVSESDNRPIAEETTGKVFFANQVIPNACATQALLSILLNIPQGAATAGGAVPGPHASGGGAHASAVDLGQELLGFREFTAELPPDMKGLAISNSDIIRAVHNSFARPEPIVPDEDQKASKDDEAFHFIAYVPVGGTLYELDGLKPGPIALCGGLDTEDAWLEAVGPHIQARMARYAASEIRFNLMALVGDARVRLERQIKEKSELRDAALSRVSSSTGSAGGAAGEGAEAEGAQGQLQAQLPSDPAALQALVGQLEFEIASLQDALAQEHAKRAAWRDENIRRRHNYIPLLFNMLKAFAEEGQLGPLITAAKSTSGSKRKAAAS